jgi:uncharacterized membrane protein HdeD (DUF308 family)
MTTLAAQNWSVFVLRGVLAIILGVLAFAVPGPTLAALILVIGWYAIIDGVIAVGAGLGAPTGPRWWIVLAGILGIAFGVYTLFNPGMTAIALVYLIAAWAVVTGVAEVIAAYNLRQVIPNEWLLALSGVLSVAFGILLAVSPGDGALAVLWIIGLYALIDGVAYVALGLRLRSVAKTLQAAEPSHAPSGT